MRLNWQFSEYCPGTKVIRDHRAVVAFEMRDACDKERFADEIHTIAGYPEDEIQCIFEPPEHWIIAATLAWEAQQGSKE